MVERSSEPVSPKRVDLGTLLRSFRGRALVSQEQLAERSGLSIRTIGNLEQGRVRSPRGESVRLLADALGLTGQDRQQFEGAARSLPAGTPEPAARWTLTPGASVPEALAPCQLPPDVADFTGRSQQVGLLRDLLTASAVGGTAPAVVVSAVAGKAGVGKTALAVHVAHQLRGQFPDGQLYVNLRGAEQQPLNSAVVLARFLRALGLDGTAIPDDQDERETVYRARLADRRVLVLLDNAASVGQVRPLLPGGSGCGVLVTSRARLVRLEGARLVDLEVLEQEQAIELLARIIGANRVAAEPDAAVAIVGYCGRLPLAIRIAGARLAARPHWPLARLTYRLADEHRRLDELAGVDLEVRASVALSYQSLGEAARRAFRCLALLNAPDFPAWVVAALLDVSPSQAEELTEDLVEAQLLEVAGLDQVGQVRYRYHDLLRLFAHERLQEEEPADARAAGLRRVVECAAALAGEADRLLERAEPSPGVAPVLPQHVASLAAVREHLRRDPLGWLEAERAGLVGAVEQAHRAEWWDLAVRLACALSGMFEIRSHWPDWERTHALAGEAGRLAGDGLGKARIACSLGGLHRERGRFGEATRCLEEALVGFTVAGDCLGQATAKHGLGQVHLDQGRLAPAIAEFQHCLPMFETAGDRRGQAVTLRRLGLAERDRGRFAEAHACLERCLSICRELGDRRGHAYALYVNGTIYHNEARFEDAVACCQASLPLFRMLRDRRGEGAALHGLGDALRERGDLAEAANAFERCLRLFRELGDPLWETAALHSLGDLHWRRGQLEEALDCLQWCLPVVRLHGDRRGEAAILHSLGQVSHDRGRSDEAAAYLHQALALFEKLGFKVWQVNTLCVLAAVQTAIGDAAAAECTTRRAEAVRLGTSQGTECSSREGCS